MSQRVFLYDANPAGRVARSAILREAGHEVAAAGAVEEARRLLEQGDGFAVAVISYSKGAEAVLERCRALQSQVPIVLVASKLDMLATDGARLGAATVVKKCANEVRHLIRAVELAARARSPRKRASSVQKKKMAAKVGA